jgi:hypothetical protein
MKYHLREYHLLFLQSIIGKNKKLKDVITSSMSTIVDRTCWFFFRFFPVVFFCSPETYSFPLTVMSESLWLSNLVNPTNVLKIHIYATYNF